MKPRWGILGTGRILAKLVGGFRLAKNAELRAVASRDIERARVAAKEFGMPVAHGSYEALLADPGIDIIFNALHNGLHCEWTVRALEAGKHVLCEKPLACNAGELERMFAAARANKRFLMEAFMFRFHPQIAAAVERIVAGDIGRVLHIRCVYMGRGRERKNPRYRKECGGGALMDLGCYCTDLARLFAGGEPTRVLSQAHWDEECGVDLTLTGTLEFTNSVTAEIACSLEDEGTFGAEVVGTDGKIVLPHPWLPPSATGEVIITRDGKSETLRFETPDLLTPFALEIEHFSACVQDGKSPEFPPGKDAERDSRGNMRTLDALWESARNGRKVAVGASV